jgi:hypothetical protein
MKCIHGISMRERCPDCASENLGANIRHEGGVPICGWCGFALIVNTPRKCCSQGAAYDSASTYAVPQTVHHD